MTSTRSRPAAVDVDAGLHRAVDGLSVGLREPCRRVLLSGGKRSRAGLVIAAASAIGRDVDGADIERAAVAIELLHGATLVHDDLIDGARTRRGVSTVNAAEGTAVAVLVGDALIGAATALATRVSREAGLILSETLQALCTGQALEEYFRYDPTVREADVLSVAEGKTAALVQAACQLGAEVGGASSTCSAALGRYGHEFGMALQLVDDVLDLTSSVELSGKPVGVDFASGTVTLPALTALREQPSLHGLCRPGLSANQQERALGLLRSGSGVSRTVRLALTYAVGAETALVGIDNGDLESDSLAARPARYVREQLAGLVCPQYRYLLAGV